MCHGKDGDGKGEVGAEMKLKISDFTDPATLKDRTDGELFYLIKVGKGDMPPKGARVKTEELWDLVKLCPIPGEEENVGQSSTVSGSQPGTDAYPS